MLCPSHTFGCKRGVIDSGYFETFNRSNVLLVDISAAPIQAITTSGIRTTDADYELDIIVFATGFDAMTGALLRIDIRGREGLPLREKWAAGPVNYLGAGRPRLSQPLYHHRSGQPVSVGQYDGDHRAACRMGGGLYQLCG